VAASLYLGPLYGGLAAWLVLGEAMGWHHLMGAALILPGIYLASRPSAEAVNGVHQLAQEKRPPQGGL
jgi:drug/metabolite transporter (DMT)-like permease